MNHSEEHEKNEEHSDETKFCQNCGSRIDVKAEICPKCGVRVALPEAQAPTGGVELLLYLIALFIPIVGFIISIIYLTRPSKDAQKFGIDYLIVVILGFFLYILFLVFITF